MIIENDIPIIKILQDKDSTYSCELVPPRNGETLENLFKKVEALKAGGVDFISVTKGAGGSLRGGTVPIAFLIKEKYNIPVIAHFTCMETTIPEIENSLVDNAYLGVTNILALRGDPPTGVFSEYKALENQHQYAYQLIEQVEGLKSGKYILRKGFDKGEESFHKGTPLNFCVGAAVYPEPIDGNVERELEYFIKKIEAGAKYGITQMTYSPKSYQLFVGKLAERGYSVPIFPGIRVVTNQKQADFLQKAFGIKIPKEYLKIIASDDQIGIKQYVKELVLKFKTNQAKGIHFFIMNESELVGSIIKELK